MIAFQRLPRASTWTASVDARSGARARLNRRKTWYHLTIFVRSLRGPDRTTRAEFHFERSSEQEGLDAAQTLCAQTLTILATEVRLC